MSWVRRLADQRQPHHCDMPDTFGDIGDLWRCDTCAQLWRGDYACPTCREFGRTRPHDGQHQVGHSWVHANWWERLRHWRAGREWVPPTQDLPTPPPPPAEPTP